MPFIAAVPAKTLAPSAPMVNTPLLWLPVIKDAFLVMMPVATWNRLAAEPRSVPRIFGVFFLPLLLLSALTEGFGLMTHGRQHLGENAINQITWRKIVICEILEIAALLLLAFLCAGFITMFGNACHRRNNLAQSLTVLLHALGPMLLVQLLNGIPGINPWMTWLAGVALTTAALYHGLPRIMQPDPPSALGLFLGSTFVVVTLLFLQHFFVCWFFLRLFRPVQSLSAIFTMNF